MSLQPSGSAFSHRRRLARLFGDRRFSQRYPIIAELECRVVSDDLVTGSGSGRSVNLSASGMLFESECLLTPGAEVEVTLAWPVLLNNKIALNLCVFGVVARSDGALHAISFREHEFCLRGRYRLNGRRFRPAA